MTNEELISILLEQQAKWMAQTMHSEAGLAEQLKQSEASFAAQLRQSEASFTARMDRLFTEHAEHEGRTRKLESAIVAGVELVNSLNQSLKETNQSLKELAEAQKKAEVEMADLRKQSAETNARLDETNERLDIFIKVLERLITEGRNGRQNGGGNA
jgi:uncharacterized NAD-dependent epimerase/dehydratase family protein